jgi:putative transposase
MVSPAAKRRAANHLVRRFKVSERRACTLVGQHRSTQRSAAVIPDYEAKLVVAMNTIADRHPRWGYRTATKLLRDQGWAVNEKRIERLWRQEGHRLPRLKAKESGQKALGHGENSSIKRPALRPNDIWTYDFMSARVRRGGPIRILNVLDEFTRRSLGSKVSRSIGAQGVVEHLELLFERHGRPRAIRSDNGREFISSSVIDYLGAEGVEPVFIAKASPTQNPFIERFNGTMRRELLNAEELETVLEAQVVIDQFNEIYNTIRPHRGLGSKTPQEFYEGHMLELR